MNKKLIGLLLALSVLVAMVLPAYAEEEIQQDEVQTATILEYLDISTVDEFLNFAQACRLDTYSIGLVVTLKRDIDLSGTEFSGVPIFSGHFNGDGHEIKGLEITGDGSYQGLFRYLTTLATVHDLKVEATVAPGGSANYVGVIAGENFGSVTDCAVVADVSGNSYVGGIVGVNGVSGLVEDCHVRGHIVGTHQVGGIAGENLGIIRGCTNRAPVNKEAKDNAVDLSDITLEALTGSESVDTSTDIGGIAGRSTGVIRKCNNHGSVGYPHIGYNVGGIAGTQSGHIVDCNNFGVVNGRKEVGGIVGQMEPVAYIEFSEDAIQMLKVQLDEMSGLVNKTAANAGGSAGAMVGQIGALQDQTDTAVEALESLITGDITDMDAILAAQNTLTSALTQMPGTVEKIAAAAQSMVGGLGRDLNKISEHIGVMAETLNGASENLGGTVTDISDLDTEELLAGKILSCYNCGAVTGDLNVGGIAGAMAFENDIDVLEDWDISGNESANFDSNIRAVVLRCENYGEVTGTKQYVGGIVGWQTLGLVKASVWSGKVVGTGAGYVGGISGYSIGYIRGSYAKGDISGNTCVGGIAGAATVITDSVAAVRIGDASEKFGAVLGIRQISYRQEEEPVSGNYYLLIDEDIGAIDAINYSGQAQPVTLEEFKALSSVPHIMRRATVSFVFEDGTTHDIMLNLGTALEAAKIPEVPYKHGFTGEWEGLSEADLSHVLYDMTFTVRYGPHGRSIQSLTEENGKPVVLAEGLFGFDAGMDIGMEPDQPALGEDAVLLRTETLLLSGETEVTAIHRLIPEEDDLESLKVWILGGDGVWRKVAHTVNGSYLVFDWSEEDVSYALVREDAPIGTVYHLAAAGVLLLVVIIVTICLKSKKKKQVTEEKCE